MLKAVKLERKAKEREVQQLHENCKDRERQDEDELQVFQFGKRTIKWVPKLYSEVSRAFEAIGTDSVNGVP